MLFSIYENNRLLKDLTNDRGEIVLKYYAINNNYDKYNISNYDDSEKLLTFYYLYLKSKIL